MMNYFILKLLSVNKIILIMERIFLYLYKNSLRFLNKEYEKLSYMKFYRFKLYIIIFR